MYILAQILCLLAIFTWVLSITLKEKKDVLLSQTLANLLYGIQYSLLQAFTAASMNFLSFIRLAVFYVFTIKKKEIPKEFLLIFIIIILVIGIVTFDTLFTFIPVIITILYAYSLWQSNLLITRIIYVVAAFGWIFYNLEFKAYIGIIGNSLEIVFGAISIYKYHIKILMRG